MMTGLEFSPKKRLEICTIQNINSYSNRYYVMKNDYIKDTRIHWKYSGRKQKATGYVYITGSPYRYDEGLSQLR